MTADRERQFWITVRQALLLVVAAIESRYQLESAVITNAQRKALHQRGVDVRRGQGSKDASRYAANDD